MWIKTEVLEEINLKINGVEENLSEILFLNYLINNNYYHLISNKKLKKVYNVLDETNLNIIIDILWTFNKDIDISNNWDEINNDFKIKFPNITKMVKLYKNKIKNFPINDIKPYIKNTTIF